MLSPRFGWVLPVLFASFCAFSAEGAGPRLPDTWRTKPEVEPVRPNLGIVPCGPVEGGTHTAVVGAPTCFSVVMARNDEEGLTRLSPSQPWGEVLKASLSTESGVVVLKSMKLAGAPAGGLDLPSTGSPVARFDLSPQETAALPPGTFVVRVELSIPETDSAAGWTGTATATNRVVFLAPTGSANASRLRFESIQYHLDHGASDKALAEAEAWVTDQPESLEARIVRGDIHFERAEWQLALNDYNAAEAKLTGKADPPPPFLQRRAAAFAKLHGLK